MSRVMLGVISNTGPIIALASVERLDLLRRLYGEVLVTEAVRDEVLQGTTGRGEFENAVAAGWIRVEPDKDSPDRLLDEVLDRGEASVIRLGLDRSGCAVLLDERKGRKLAGAVYGLRVFGTVRVLLDAKKRGLVSHVGEILREMRVRGYWFSDGIVASAMKAAGEERDAGVCGHNAGTPVAPALVDAG